MKFLLRKPYIFIIAVATLVYLALVIWITGFYNTFILALIYSETVSWLKLSSSMVLSLLIALLVGANFTYLYREYKVKKNCKKGSTVTSAGAVGGILVGVCPVCVGGVLQTVLVGLGISFSFAALPFDGIELQSILVLLLGSNVYWMESNSKNKFKKLKGGIK